MRERVLFVGRWIVEFYFCDGGYDADVLTDRLYTLGAGYNDMRKALALMESGQPNTGFTFANPLERHAVVAIGPTDGGDEFIDTLVHEIHHLAVAIAAELGVTLDAENPAYVAGDSARELAEVICELGCRRCHD